MGVVSGRAGRRPAAGQRGRVVQRRAAARVRPAPRACCAGCACCACCARCARPHRSVPWWYRPALMPAVISLMGRCSSYTRCRLAARLPLPLAPPAWRARVRGRQAGALSEAQARVSHPQQQGSRRAVKRGRRSESTQAERRHTHPRRPRRRPRSSQLPPPPLPQPPGPEVMGRTMRRIRGATGSADMQTARARHDGPSPLEHATPAWQHAAATQLQPDPLSAPPTCSSPCPSAARCRA